MLARQGWAEERGVTQGGMVLVGLRGPRNLTHLPLLPSCYTSGSKIGVEPSCPACEVGRAQRVALICSIYQIRKLRPQENTLHDFHGPSIVNMPTVYHSLRNAPPSWRRPPSAQLQQSREHLWSTGCIPVPFRHIIPLTFQKPAKPVLLSSFFFFLGQEAEAQTD